MLLLQEAVQVYPHASHSQMRTPKRKVGCLMGTRGFVGFVSGEKETITYNHFDSYPAGLGAGVLDFLRSLDAHTEEYYRQSALTIRHVDQATSPTREDIVKLAKYANLNVSTGQATEWYVLLRETQGNPAAILESGYAEHAPNWPLDSLFCEWGYLIDFDHRKLEVYQGFQRTAPENGRWQGRRMQDSNGYYAVDLVAVWSFDNLPSDREMEALES
jgi:hypothetical protein